MQNASDATRSTDAPHYRERLSPSLWTFVAAAAVAPMAALVLVPFGDALSLVVGVGVAIALVVLLVLAAPVVTVVDGELRAGRAHIPVDLLGAPRVFTGEEARTARGTELRATDHHLIRGGIDGVLVVDVVDPDDPTPAWVISTRTPERLAAVIDRARTTPRTPRR